MNADTDPVLYAGLTEAGVDTHLAAIMSARSAQVMGRWLCFWCVVDEPGYFEHDYLNFATMAELLAHVRVEHILTQLSNRSAVCRWRRWNDDASCGFMRIERLEVVRHVLRHHVMGMCERRCGCGDRMQTALRHSRALA